jgi:hypothetical protein
MKHIKNGKRFKATNRMGTVKKVRKPGKEAEMSTVPFWRG